MADSISDDLLDEVCEEIATLSEPEARAEMERLAKLQPALLAYVIATTEDLAAEAQELAIYMFVVIHRAFEKQFGKRLQNAGMKRVEEISENNEKQMQNLAGRDEEVIDLAESYTEIQPNLFRYVCECLLEPEDADDVEISEDDQGTLTFVMKTVIDVLDSSVPAL